MDKVEFYMGDGSTYSIERTITNKLLIKKIKCKNKEDHPNDKKSLSISNLFGNSVEVF